MDYLILSDDNGGTARLTTDPSASSYGIPVLVLDANVRARPAHGTRRQQPGGHDRGFSSVVSRRFVAIRDPIPAEMPQRPPRPHRRSRSAPTYALRRDRLKGAGPDSVLRSGLRGTT
ncbi:hypothetical protein BDD21_5425 [Thiocapsa rosea]|uniref:Uncharacterized protein n=1 Tax=Thiocapsa rosea TaxID=69360 RepID=A0A495UKV5_9GAMM|nr:hypothetical protein BDD21_5425 [Thiocapsa rosea]